MGPTGEQWWCPHHIQTISILPFLLIWIIFWIESQTIIVNWIIYWIESQWFIWIWIIFWIEFSLNDFELNIELNQFCAKFKLWIESIWVSNRAKLHWIHPTQYASRYPPASAALRPCHALARSRQSCTWYAIFQKYCINTPHKTHLLFRNSWLTVCQLRVSPYDFFIFVLRLPKHFYWFQHS